jgi:hypothetical protein
MWSAISARVTGYHALPYIRSRSFEMPKADRVMRNSHARHIEQANRTTPEKPSL